MFDHLRNEGIIIMTTLTKRNMALIGVFLSGLSLLAFITFGWIIWSFLFLTFPEELIRGQAQIEDWFIAAYGLEIPILFITGISILKWHKHALPLALMATFFTFITIGIWLSVGNWPWIILINSGSAQPSLMFGERILLDGDYTNSIYQINPQIWLVKMGVLAIVFFFVSFLLIKLWPRDVKA